MFRLLITFAAAAPLSAADLPDLLDEADTVLWLGDSVTYAGGYVAAVETALRRDGRPIPRIINLGLPSEGVTGLTESSHPFPRPNVHERLGRALERIEADLVVACYGMNDGIYAPLSEERFAAYRAGIEKLIDAATAAGAEVVLLTPPPFDPTAERVRDALVDADAAEFGWKAVYRDYDDVLARYAAHVSTLGGRVAAVVDTHTASLALMRRVRRNEPDAVFSADGVHPNARGHLLLAAAVLGRDAPLTLDGRWSDVLTLVKQRQDVLKAAYLTEVGHKRPGMKDGPPVEEAEREAAKLLNRIEAAAAK